MHDRRELNPGSAMFAVFVLLAVAMAAVIFSPRSAFPALHPILDTAVFLLSALLAFLLWDMGWRTSQRLPELNSVCFAIVAALELLHVVTALAYSDPDVLGLLPRIGTWSPAAYLLPLGMLVALPLSRRGVNVAPYAAGLMIAAVGLMLLFTLPRYSQPGVLGITRPSLLLAPLLWIPVMVIYWRVRNSDRLASEFAIFAAITLCVPAIMLFSRDAADKYAVIAHLVRVVGELFLLFRLTQMGTSDTAQRMRAERALKESNEALEARVAARTAQLENLNTDLRREIGVRHDAEVRTLMQLERLELLRRITHAIAERQDLASIIQVVVRSVEDNLPADFVAICNYEREAGQLTVKRIGTRSHPLALGLAMTENAHIPIDQNGLARCVSGQQVYEPDISGSEYPFPQRLARAGLKSMVIVPLMVERAAVFAVLVVARRAANAFSSGECEFLRQLCDQVALAANQAQLHDSLQQAYEDLKRTQEAVLEQERLRALGQMASGIAHDINNAISPVAVYVESLLTHEQGFGDRARRQLQIIQRAVDDVARTVARMGEFYRRRPAQQELALVAVGRVLREVLDLTRARWSDMAQQRGVVIETRVEVTSGDVKVMAVESELREALVNLVLNAIDAMPEGGRLVMRAGRNEAGRVYIEVADDGIGMDEDTRRRCLEPFFTTKGERGSGLGLAMVYGIAQRHDMEIDISSAPKTGTTFRLVFPTQSPAVSGGPASKPRTPVRTRILLIDDDPLLLSSLREVLTRDGHEIETANGGRQGVDVFLESLEAGRPYPVVITDLGMPHFDGRAVAAAIATASPGTPIIMLTGWGQRLAATGETPPEVTAVLSKPPRLAELRQKLAECVGESSGELTEKDVP